MSNHTVRKAIIAHRSAHWETDETTWRLVVRSTCGATHDAIWWAVYDATWRASDTVVNRAIYNATCASTQAAARSKMTGELP